MSIWVIFKMVRLQEFIQNKTLHYHKLITSITVASWRPNISTHHTVLLQQTTEFQHIIYFQQHSILCNIHQKKFASKQIETMQLNSPTNLDTRKVLAFTAKMKRNVKYVSLNLT